MNIGFHIHAVGFSKQWNISGSSDQYAVNVSNGKHNSFLWTPMPFNLFHMSCKVRISDVSSLIKACTPTPPPVMSLAFRLRVRAGSLVDNGWGVVVETANGHVVRMHLLDHELFTVRPFVDKRNLGSLWKMREI